MKTITFGSIVGLLFLGVLTSAHGWEFQGNPDRFPSLGLMVYSGHLSGDRDEVDLPGQFNSRANGGETTLKSKDWVLDLRLPVHDALTVNLSVDSSQSVYDFTRVGNIYTQHEKLDGYRIGAGIRYYFIQ